MILKEIKIEDFRQFYGTQEPIVFAEGNQNITIIFGDNGDGKTGIFRALMFALFGTQYLAQDDEKEDIHLVNMLKLKEKEGQPITAAVTVTFKHDFVTWILKREVVGIQNGGNIIEKTGEVKLNRIDADGNYSPETKTDEEEINKIINNVIDEKIKDFFLFDGEKIETLARTNREVKAEIKGAIIKLLQIDKVSKSLDILNNMYKAEHKAITVKSTSTDVRSAQVKLDSIEEEISITQELMDTYRENLIMCQMEIESTEEKLSEAKPIRELQNKISSLKKERDGRVELLDAHKKSLRESYFNMGHSIYMESVYPKTKSYLNQLLIKQKDLVPIEVIRSILIKNECICGESLEKNPEAFEHIKRLEKQYERSRITPFIGQVNGAIDDYEMKKDDVAIKIREMLTKIMEIKDEVEEYNDQIKDLQKLKSNKSKDESNLKSLEDKLNEHQSVEKDLKNDINRFELKIENLERNQNEAQREYDKVMGADESLRNDQKRLTYTRRLKDEFEKLFLEYSDEMRTQLMEETTIIFKNLIDKKDRDLIDRIEINPKYEIELHNWNGTKITQDISQGQRQIVALSFITALAKIAANGRESIDFPLFMDTPFGRMSGANRDNLIQNIPHLSSQWILLLTDTEFSESEELMVKSTGKLGKWYRLDQQKVYHTIIREVGLNEKMATRR